MENQKAKILRSLNLDDPLFGMKKPADGEKLFPLSGNEDVLNHYATTLRPSVIVEVGSYLGRSAIHLARTIKEADINAVIVCIDTWLGSLEHWMDYPHELKLERGRPTLYERFVDNVNRCRVNNFILPLSMTSSTAVRFFDRKDFCSDMTYIDGDHDYREVLHDLLNWGRLTSEVIIVDDMDWSSVAQAVADYNDQQDDWNLIFPDTNDRVAVFERKKP